VNTSQQTIKFSMMYSHRRMEMDLIIFNHSLAQKMIYLAMALNLYPMDIFSAFIFHKNDEEDFYNE
jgi:hypothetical protein